MAGKVIRNIIGEGIKYDSDVFLVSRTIDCRKVGKHALKSLSDKVDHKNVAVVLTKHKNALISPPTGTRSGPGGASAVLLPCQPPGLRYNRHGKRTDRLWGLTA